MGIRLLLVDDHQMFRQVLRVLLEAEADMQVVGEASNGREAVAAAERLQPTVVVMDIAMSELNGIEATRRIVRDVPQTRVLALSMYSDHHDVLTMLEAGASGYVLKVAPADELVRAVQLIAAGKSYLCPEITGVLVDGYVGRLFPDDHSPTHLLGSREREVLQLLAEGKSSPQIAKTLHIAVKTVDTHRSHIMQKLDLHNVAKLTKYAVRHGLTSLDT